MNINDYLNYQLSVPRTLKERREMKDLELIRRNAYDTYKADMDLINNAYFNENKIDTTTYDKLKANAANQYLQHTLPTIRETSFGTSAILDNVYKNAPELGRWIDAQAMAYNTTPQVIVSVMGSPEFTDVFGVQHQAWRGENLVKANPDVNFSKWIENSLSTDPYNKYEKVDVTKIKPNTISKEDMLKASKTLGQTAKNILGALDNKVLGFYGDINDMLMLQGAPHYTQGEALKWLQKNKPELLEGYDPKTNTWSI